MSLADGILSFSVNSSSQKMSSFAATFSNPHCLLTVWCCGANILKWLCAQKHICDNQPFVMPQRVLICLLTLARCLCCLISSNTILVCVPSKTWSISFQRNLAVINLVPINLLLLLFLGCQAWKKYPEQFQCWSLQKEGYVFQGLTVSVSETRQR